MSSFLLCLIFLMILIISTFPIHPIHLIRPIWLICLVSPICLKCLWLWHLTYTQIRYCDLVTVYRFTKNNTSLPPLFVNISDNNIGKIKYIYFSTKVYFSVATLYVGFIILALGSEPVLILVVHLFGACLKAS